jgi:SNF2 family DNA or RNA helicase
MPAPRVHIELDDKGERIVLKSPFFPGVSEMCQEVPGHSWSKTRSSWSYPVSLQTCRMLRHVFTDMLVIGKRLSSWAKTAIAEEEGMRALGKLSDTELDRLHEVLPRLAGAMDARTYQRVGASFIANQPDGGVLLADQPGLGKSIQTLGGIVERGLEVGLHLVACPATAINIVWGKEVRKWTDFRVFPVMGSATQKHKAIEAALSAPEDEPRFVVINPETSRIKMGRWCPKCKEFLEDFGTPQQDIDHIEAGHKTSPKPYEIKFPELFVPRWTSIIVDESHRFLSGIKGAHAKTQMAEGLCRLLLEEDGLKVALSGTPVKGNPINFWGVLHWLNPKKYSSKWTWAQQYLEVQETRFGQSIGGLAPHRAEALYRDLDYVMLRRTKAEVAKDLPPKQYLEHWCEPSPQQQKQYDEMAEMGEAMFGTYAVSATGILAELTRLRQIATAYQGENGPVLAKSCKWIFLLELLEERGLVGPNRYSTGSKYVIASQFGKVLNAMEAEFAKLKVPTLKITGEVTGKNRLRAQESFQAAGGPRIMLLNTMAGGVAIDLDQHCDELFFMDETFVPDDQEQVEDRIHRVSRIHNVTIHYLYAKGSIDEKIAGANVSKDMIKKKILDGRRGVDFALRLLKE